MESFYLLDYLKQNSDIPHSKIDLLKYELDQRIYYYGNHFKNHREIVQSSKSKLKNVIKDIYCRYLLLKRIKTYNKKIIISNAYFTINSELEKENIKTLRPIHNVYKNAFIAGNLNLYRQYKRLNGIILFGDFNKLLSKDTDEKINSFQSDLTHWYNTANISALIVPNDQSFFDLLNILIFKDLQKPSFIFLHGLPCRYNIYDENQTDYLIVWGEKIKEHYIKVGFDPDKIFVSGHPYYKLKQKAKLRNSLENILIITKSAEGAQYRDKVRVADRGNLILYLYSIQNVLQKMGVKQVRFRPHPSESSQWYFQFIDQKFFKLDTLNLSNSLNHSSLVIGPNSTVLLQSLYHDVNYLIYEPTINNLNLVGFKLVPPFDGSDKKIPGAQNEKELFDLIKNKASVEPSVLNDYIQAQFDISFIKRLI